MVCMKQLEQPVLVLWLHILYLRCVAGVRVGADSRPDGMAISHPFRAQENRDNQDRETMATGAMRLTRTLLKPQE